jgi:ubiquinone/menaquinone biosynthesis C-methylase UbiE
MKIPKFLSYWQDTMPLEKVERLFGNYNASFKVKNREHIINRGYKTLLDVGAGAFSEFYGFKDTGYEIGYTATEITPKYIDWGLSRGINAIQQKSFSKLDFDDRSFDVCLSYDMLNHQPDYRDILKELVRVAKKEVIVSFFLPFSEEIQAGAVPKTWEGSFSRFTTTTTDLGQLQFRVSNITESGDGAEIIEEATCLYLFPYQTVLKEFLDNLPNTRYEFELVEAPSERRRWILHIVKE